MLVRISEDLLLNTDSIEELRVMVVGRTWQIRLTKTSGGYPILGEYATKDEALIALCELQHRLREVKLPDRFSTITPSFQVASYPKKPNIHIL